MAFLPHTYGALLLGAMILSVFMVMASTVTGAFLVEAGQRMSATGRLTSLRMLVSNFCTLVQGPAGGFLATVGFAWATGVKRSRCTYHLSNSLFLFEGTARAPTRQRHSPAER
jgi:hypothetical protein